MSLFLVQVHLRRPTSTHSAASSIAAGVSSTFVDPNLTAGPSEARPAGTGVAALASVATSGSIHAGLVVSAVVEIWKKHSSTCGLARAQHMAGQQQRRQYALLSSGTLDCFSSASGFLFPCLLSLLKQLLRCYWSVDALSLQSTFLLACLKPSLWFE